MAQSHLKNIAIVGATGRVGKHFADALLATGKHTITAITRADSTTTLPPTITKAIVNYDDESSIVAALKGQDFLIVTLPVTAAPDTHSKLSRAAAAAGVPYVMPNIYGFDIFNDNLQRSGPRGVGAGMGYVREIEALGKSAWVAMCCGFWYEWSLALGEQWYGFSIKERKVTFFDDGTTKINSSTWLQCGRAVAALLSLPAEGDGSGLSVTDWKNKPLYISSFRISQRDMLDSLHRVLDTTDADWAITYEATDKRVADGNAEFAKGDIRGFAKAMYSRIFFPTGDGEFESTKGTANEKLGLPVEELDEATRRTVEMVESGWNPFGH